MNYNKLILDFFEINKTKDMIEPLNDYYILMNMKLSNNINTKYIIDVYNKYLKEINIIDNYRSIKCFSRGEKIQVCDLNQGVVTIDVLMDHLLSIISFRYTKNINDNIIKQNIVSSKNKELYDLLCYIRNKTIQ